MTTDYTAIEAATEAARVHLRTLRPIPQRPPPPAEALYEAAGIPVADLGAHLAVVERAVGHGFTASVEVGECGTCHVAIVLRGEDAVRGALGVEGDPRSDYAETAARG